MWIVFSLRQTRLAGEVLSPKCRDPSRTHETERCPAFFEASRVWQTLAISIS